MQVCAFHLPPAKLGATAFRVQLAKRFGGYTAIPCTGGWVNDDGELITEPMVRYIVAVNTKKDMEALFCDAYDRAKALNEQALYFEAGVKAFVTPIDHRTGAEALYEMLLRREVEF